MDVPIQGQGQDQGQDQNNMEIIKTIQPTIQPVIQPTIQPTISTLPQSHIKIISVSNVVQNKKKDIVIGPLIDSISHLKEIVMMYGKKVFTSTIKTINNDMLEFICDNFITSTFLYNGKNIGYIDKSIIDREKSKDPLLESSYNHQRNTIERFWILFQANFFDDMIRDPLQNARAEKKIGEGTYGIILPYIDPNTRAIDKTKLIKYIKSNNSVHINVSSHPREFYVWFIEFCTFIIIMALLMYVDCHMIVDESQRMQCIESRYKNHFTNPDNGKEEYFLSYYSFMAKLNIPFCNKTSKPNVFVLGYVIEAYDQTMYSLYDTFNSSSKQLYNAVNLTSQIFDILQKLSYLNKFGIIISHRDISTNNIMYSKDSMKKNLYKICLIDFGFLCTNIKCKDGTVFSIGYHYNAAKNDMDKCNKSYLDLLIFISYCLRFHTSFFSTIKQYCNFDAYSAFEKIVILNSGYMNNNFNALKESADDFLINIWQYTTEFEVLLQDRNNHIIGLNKQIDLENTRKNQKIPHHDKIIINDKLITNMFNDAKKILDKIKEILLKKMKPLADEKNPLEDTDYGTYGLLFNISDNASKGELERFYSLYQTNKSDYIKLK
jgi:hypothetical protein